MLNKIYKTCPIKIECVDGSHLPKSISYENINSDSGYNLHFFINSGFESEKINVKLPTGGVEKLDTVSDEVIGYPSVKEGECQLVEISLPPAGHLLLQETDENTPLKTEEKFTKIKIDNMESNQTVRFDSIEKTAPNVLPIHYCSLTVGKEKFDDIKVPKANKKCWREHGFENDIWCSAMQFKDNYSDFVFNGDSGFEVEYFFQIDDSINKSTLNSFCG